MFLLAPGISNSWPYKSEEQGKEGTIYRAPYKRKEKRDGLKPALRVFGTDWRREFAGD